MHQNNIQTVSGFRVQDFVVYGSAGVCRFTGIVKKCFDGVNKIDYLALEPINSANSTYYVPIDAASSRLRKLLSKDKIYELIDNMKNDCTEWCSDNKERRELFSSTLRSHDVSKILIMLKILHIQKEEKAKNGKHLVTSDELAKSEGENLIYSEFSLVLGIEYDDVEEFICNHIGVTQ